MKKRITIWLLILTTSYCFSQDCDEIRTEILNGEIYDFQLENCTSDVTINTLGENTNLHGVILIDALESINLKTTGNHRISIKPNDPLDFIDLLVTNNIIDFGEYLGCRACNGNRTVGAKNLDEKIIIYPNPADVVLTIETEESISYYKIVTDNGFTVKEGTLPVSKQLNVESLTKGIYYLLLQIENEIVAKTLIKN